MRIAIVGAGIAGLVAAHVLRRAHDVRLLEAAPRPGGHTHTVDVEADGRRVAVDTGFIVHNDRTYPHFVRLLEQLGIETQPSDMSFSVQDEATGRAWCGTSLSTFFAQRRNLLRPSMWGMLRDVLRFNREAPRLLEDDAPERALGPWLREQGYGEAFLRLYIRPMGAAVWSSDPDGIERFPARYFVRFFANHGFLQLRDRPTWRTIVGGARRYVDAIADRLGERLQVGTPVRRIQRGPEGVRVEAEGRGPETYDAVVLAVHSDQALRLLADPSDAEREILGAIPYQENEAVLHTDVSLLPASRRAWAAWNVHLPGPGADGPADRVRVTYDLTRLQRLPGPTRHLVTLNHAAAIDPSRVLRRIVYHHPVYTLATRAAQARRGEISGPRSTFYCGAYWRWGFHEDGVVSALDVCRALGVEP